MSFSFPSPATAPRSRRSPGFTLVELIVAVALLAVGTGIAYPLFVGDFNLYIRNFSLNKSDNSLRTSLQALKNDIDMSIEPPTLVNYSVSGSTGVLTPQGSSVVSATGILLWVNLGPAYDMVPTAGADTGLTVSPANGIKLCYSKAFVAGALVAPAPIVMPQIGDRLIIENPSPYSTGMPDLVTMNGVTIQKPGRRITGVTNNGGGILTVQLDLTNPLPPGITGDQSVYVVREKAYVANTTANSTERQLLRYASTASMTNPNIVVRDLDPNPQEIDATTGKLILPFNYYPAAAGGVGGRGTLTALTIILPVRALDYAQTIGDRNLKGTTTDTSSTEFNVYLRSNTQMGVKARLD